MDMEKIKKLREAMQELRDETSTCNPNEGIILRGNLVATQTAILEIIDLMDPLKA